MKKSIKSLPKCTQKELNVLRDLILQHLPKCTMIILFGSYAKKKYVIYDQSIENGMVVYYQSDLDLLIIMDDKSTRVGNERVTKRILPKYNRIMNETSRRHAPARIIVESIQFVNKKLELNQFFFKDIVKEGILLYDSGEHILAKPRELSIDEVYKISKDYFDISFSDGSQFLIGGEFYYKKEWYKLGSFLLHQACENLYHTIELVYTHYHSKNHKLTEIGPPLARYSTEFNGVFPVDDPFKKKCYKLLCEAYIKARYDINFVVTKEEFEYLVSRLEILKEITQRVCQKHLDSLKKL